MNGVKEGKEKLIEVQKFNFNLKKISNCINLNSPEETFIFQPVYPLNSHWPLTIAIWVRRAPLNTRKIMIQIKNNLMYWDVNNLHGWPMSQTLPADWVKDTLKAVKDFKNKQKNA